MITVKSTPEILAFKVLNRSVNKVWIDWAVEMLTAGNTSENLIYLAGENEKTNQFELQEIAERALNELGLNYSDKGKVVDDYLYFLLKEAILNNRDQISVLTVLKDLCIELDYPDFLYDFYSLYFAYEDLSYDTNQWYWDGATRENITEVIKNYFERRFDNLK